MKKIIALIWLLFSVNLFSSPNTSSGYNNMKDLISSMDEVQKGIKLHSLIINSLLGQISSICGDKPSCYINEKVTFTVTNEMKELDSSNELSVGNTITIPANTLTFNKLEDETFNYSIVIDISKLDQSEIGKETFKWDSDGKIKSVTFEQGSIKSHFISIISPSGNTLISKGNSKDKLDPFNQSSPEINTKYQIKMKQYGTKNGVELTSSFEIDSPSFTTTIPDTGEQITLPQMHFKEESIAKADDNGGYIESSIIEDNQEPLIIKEKFNGNGDIIETAIGDNSINADIYQITEDSLAGTNYDMSNISFDSDLIFFAVVKEGETPKIENIIGVGSYFKEDDNTEKFHFDYFGDKKLLADTNSTSDTDKLDIYIDNQDGTFSNLPINGIWLKK